MKLMAAAVLLFSAQAFACPALTGAFTCTYSDGSKEVLNITQDVSGSTTTYHFNGSDVIADGQARPVADDEGIRNATLKFWCEDDVTLKALLAGQYFNQNAYYGDLSMNIDFSLAGNDLQQVTSGAIKNANGSTPINQKVTCTKN